MYGQMDCLIFYDISLLDNIYNICLTIFFPVFACFVYEFNEIMQPSNLYWKVSVLSKSLTE